jgi:hypothetical protein
MWTHSDVSILHLHSSVDVHAVSTVLQLHFRGHFRVHFRTSSPTFICGHTATSVSYTYTHLLYILHIVPSSTSMPVCVASIYTSAAHHLPCFQGGKECMATVHSSDRDFTFPYILHLHLANIFVIHLYSVINISQTFVGPQQCNMLWVNIFENIQDFLALTPNPVYIF